MNLQTYSENANFLILISPLPMTKYSPWPGEHHGLAPLHSSPPLPRVQPRLRLRHLAQVAAGE